MTKEEALKAKDEISTVFEEISARMCALQLQYPELGMLAAYRFAQHSIIDTKGCVPADNVTSTALQSLEILKPHSQGWHTSYILSPSRRISRK